MEKDFHFAVTYVVGRLAGFAHAPALVIATAAQYVDDTVSEGTIRFRSGEAYRRVSTAHETFNPKIAFSSAERQVWVPFHFLPSAEPDAAPADVKAAAGPAGSGDERFYSAIVCRPNSAVARAMLKLCIERQDPPFALHRLGITAHVFVDTWAHQGFAGVKHVINRATRIRLGNFRPGRKRFAHIQRAVRTQGLNAYFSRWAYVIVCKLLNAFFPMGHGTVLHYPDWPFLVWSYVNGRGVTVARDNPKDFLEAAEELHRFFQRHRAGDAQAPTRDLPSADRALIREMLTTIRDEAGDLRCERWIRTIAAGQFSFGPAEIAYFPKGPQSWKFAALGTDETTDHFWEKFDYTPAFLASDWKLFHDAVQAHQVEMAHEVFPAFGICVS